MIYVVILLTKRINIGINKRKHIITTFLPCPWTHFQGGRFETGTFNVILFNPMMSEN